MTEPTNVASTTTNAEPAQTNTTDQGASQAAETVAVEPKPWETVKHKIKVNDVDQEFSYQELIDRAQKGMGADSRFQEAAQMRKQAEAALKLFKTDPTQAFKLLNVDPKSWAAKYLEESAFEAMLTPEQKAARDEKNSMLSKIEELEALKKEKNDAANAQLMAKVEKQLGDQVIQALEASNMPKTREVVKRIAQKMLVYRQAGYKDVTAADVMPYVKQEYQEDLKALLGGTAEDQLEGFLGEDTVKKLINYRNQQIQDSQSPFKSKPRNNSSNGKKNTKVAPKITPEQWRKNLLDNLK